jgi:hypothetical protein
MRYLIAVLLALALVPVAVWGQRTLQDGFILWDISTPGQIKALPAFPEGSVRIAAQATTTITTQNEWTPLGGNFALCPFAEGVVLGAVGGQICNDTAHEWLFAVDGSISIQAAANNQAIEIAFARSNVGRPPPDDGPETVFLLCSQKRQESRFSTEWDTVSTSMIKPLKPSECFYVVVRNTTSTADVAVANSNIRVLGRRIVP